MELCGQLGVKLLNLSAGSPYYNPHIQRPAAYPPSDGYQPAHDPLIDVARQINVVREFKSERPKGMAIIGSATAICRNTFRMSPNMCFGNNWTDMVGLTA